MRLRQVMCKEIINEYMRKKKTWCLHQVFFLYHNYMMFMALEKLVKVPGSASQKNLRLPPTSHSIMIKITSHTKHHNQYLEVDVLGSIVSMKRIFVQK
jgi:hypothetical protein